MKNRKQPPPKEIGCQSCEVHVVIRSEKALEYPILAEKLVSISVKTFFFFCRSPDFGRKKRSNFRFWQKISLNFGEDLCFFWKSPVFGRKKRSNFRAFREIPSQFSNKPCDSDSRRMKIWIKVVCSFLTLSKKPPPPFSKSWLRACPRVPPFLATPPTTNTYSTVG